MLGREFELRTEHMSLKYLFDQPRLNARQARWMEFLCEFHFEIKQVKGKYNKVVEDLSRRFRVAAVSVYKSDLRVIKSQNNDGTYLQVKQKLQWEKPNEKCKGYHLGEDDILVYKGRLYILNCADLKKLVMDEIHQMPYYEHLRYQRQ